MPPAPSSPAEPDSRRALARMQRVATGLLGASLTTLVAAKYFEPRYPALAYLAAFAEAATIGGLADWYAVTALFRRPLGLPIPHTAILPANQERVADSLGDFIETQFLRPDAVRAKLAEVDFAAMVVDWLGDRARAEALAGFVVRTLPQLLDAADHSRARAFISERVRDAARRADVAPYLASLVEGLTAAGRHQQIFTDLLGLFGRLLLEPGSVETIWRKIREELPSLLRIVGADGFLLRKILIAAAEFLDEVQKTPDHPLRSEVDKAAARLVDDLRRSPEFRAKVDAFKTALLDRPETAELLDVAWRGLRAWIEREIASDASQMRAQVADVLLAAGRQLDADSALKAELNAGMVAALAAFVEGQKSAVSRFVSQQVKGWDMAHMTRIVEEKIGRDLQYIRFNGTLIGGLIGLVLYAAMRAAGLR